MHGGWEMIQLTSKQEIMNAQGVISVQTFNGECRR